MDSHKLIKRHTSLFGRRTSITLEDLKHFYLVPGNVHLKYKDSSKEFRVLNTFGLIDDEFTYRFRNQADQPFILETRINLKWVNHITKVFNEFKASYLPDEFLKLQDKLRIELASAMWTVDSEISLADLAYACFQIFHQQHQQVTQELYTTDVNLFKRALFVSSLNVVLAYIAGYNDIKFLADIYRVGWMLDSGLVGPDYSYSLLMASQYEKKDPGAGLKYLQSQNRPESEIELYLKHPKLSYEKVKKEGEKLFFYPEIIQTILYHHEQSDGSGFPEKINYSSLSDFESIVILSDYFVDYSDADMDKLYDLNLRKLWEELDKPLFARLPIYRLKIKIERVLHYWSQFAQSAGAV
jgi:hypothetical protein